MESALGTLTLVSSLILVAITGWYAWQTHMTVVEMQESRRASVRPHIRMDLEPFGVNVLVKVENLGAGPALDVRATVKLGEDTPQSVEWSTPVLRSGESRLLHFPVKQDGSTMSFAELRELGVPLVLFGSCSSVAGDSIQLRDAIEFDETLHKEVNVSSSKDVSERLKKIADELAGIRKAMS